MEVNDFEIVLTDVTFYLQHLQKLVLNKLVLNVVTKNKINEYNRKLKGKLPCNIYLFNSDVIH